MDKKPARGISRRDGLALAGLLCMPQVLRAQSAWPKQLIRFVVPFTPGGSTDLLARVLAQKLEPVLKTPVIVDNRPGAGGIIAASAVARAEPDGHTFMMGHIGTLGFNPSLYETLPYDPLTDFAPVALVASVPNILTINPALPVRTLAEFLAYAREKPRSLTFGSGGIGSAAHVAGAYLAFAAGFDATHVPYRGTGPMIVDLISGTIQFTLTGGPAVLPQAAAGKLRTLAVSSLQRVPFAPDLPTLAESGLPAFEAVQWYGLVAPAKTPTGIVERMNAEINALMDSPEIAKNLQNDGALAIRTTPEAFAKHIAQEITVWRAVIKRAGIKAE